MNPDVWAGITCPLDGQSSSTLLFTSGNTLASSGASKYLAAGLLSAVAPWREPDKSPRKVVKSRPEIKDVSQFQTQLCWFPSPR